MRVIMWQFAGRQPNMEIQRPFIEHILKEHPNVEFHVWNLARAANDNQYVRTVTGDRITVFNDVYVYGPEWHLADREVWRHYADPEYQDCLFVKIDDDVVFLQVHRFGAFLAAVDTHRGSVLSANVINNAACTPVEPGLWEVSVLPPGAEPDEGLLPPWLTPERMRLRKFDHSIEHARLAHNYFFDHHRRMLDQPIRLISTKDYLCIHLVGYDWRTGVSIVESLDPITEHGGNAETPANNFPCIIMRGFLAAHLMFGGQEHGGHHAYGVQEHERLVASWRDRYADIGQRYLAEAVI